MGLSDLAIKAAHFSPLFTNLVFQTAGSAMPRHWVIDRIRKDLGIRVKLPAVLSNGMKIKVFANDPIGNAIRRDGYYEQETVEVVKSLLKPGKVFFDIGANIGQYALVAGAMGVRTEAFEPDPSVFDVLCNNVRMNDLEKLCRCWPIALSIEKGRAAFHESLPENLGAGSLAHQSQSSGRTLMVATDTLDNVAAATDVCAIKIDVEGAELLVLSAGGKVLSKRPPIVIEFCDKHQRSFDCSNVKLAEFLRRYGYILSRITEEGVIPYEPRDPEESFFNVLAV